MRQVALAVKQLVDRIELVLIAALTFLDAILPRSPGKEKLN
jgi:hypothetical protein